MVGLHGRTRIYIMVQASGYLQAPWHSNCYRRKLLLNTMGEIWCGRRGPKCVKGGGANQLGESHEVGIYEAWFY